MTAPEMPDAQECKRQALLLIQQLEGRRMQGVEAQISLMGAQVWATLATVPEPPEEEITDLDPVVGELISPFPRFPIVKCPHGHVIAYEPQEDGSLQLQYGAFGCAGCC